MWVCVSVCCRLDQEARDNFMKVIEIDDRLKMADYIQLIPAYAFWGLNLQDNQEILKAPFLRTLKALEYAEKTSSNLYHGSIYENLVREYTLIWRHGSCGALL